MLSAFRVLFHWCHRIERSRITIATIILAGFLAGLGNTALLAVINTALSGRSSSYRALLFIFITLCVLIPASAFLSQVLLVRLTAKATYDMRRGLCHSILSAPLPKLEEIGMARLFGILTDDIATMTTTISSLPGLLTQCAVICGCLAYLAYLSLPLFTVVIIYMAIGVATYQLPLRKAFAHFKAMRDGLDALYRSLHAVTDGCKELKLNRYRRQGFFTEQLEPDLEFVRSHSVTGSTYSVATNNLGQALIIVVIGVVLFAAPIAMHVDRHTLTGYILNILYMNGPLAAILNTLPNLGRAQIAFDKITSLGLSLHNEDPEHDLQSRPAGTLSWAKLELTGITHQYRSDGKCEAFMLGPLDLAFNRGELIFLIGGNGSGKTTLAKLLAGLYVPQTGEIKIDGSPVTNRNRDDYRQKFCVLFSDYFLFGRLFGVGGEHKSVRANDYLKILQLDHKVKIENGQLSSVDLSSGQRKRLALLTAYLEDRSIYIFDEWAADQDPVFKRFFYCEILPELKAAGKTLIVISHDDRFFYLADRIIKLENGQLEGDKSAVTGNLA